MLIFLLVTHKIYHNLSNKERWTGLDLHARLERVLIPSVLIFDPKIYLAFTIRTYFNIMEEYRLLDSVELIMLAL
jgi:hypothetical protein